MFKHRGLLIIFLCLIFASILGFFMFANNTPKAQNLFTYKDIAITQEQNIKTLMSAGGNVVIDSTGKIVFLTRLFSQSEFDEMCRMIDQLLTDFSN